MDPEYAEKQEAYTVIPIPKGGERTKREEAYIYHASFNVPVLESKISH